MVQGLLDPAIMVYGEGVGAYYEEVFGSAPEVTFELLPGGDTAIVLEGWIWLFYSGIEERWIARVVCPKDDPLYSRHPCLIERDGLEVEKPSFEDCVLFALELDTHRRFHLAQESLPRR